MVRAKLMLVLLLIAAFGLAAFLQPRLAARTKNVAQDGNVLAFLLGDVQKMLARQMMAKADGYFHRGNYPSIFDQTPRNEENHMEEAQHEDHTGHNHAEGEHPEEEEETPARDWIEKLGRRFHPTAHAHLKDGDEREMLPWLRMAAQLDSRNPETYAVTAYWLGDRMNKVDEAEQFLREGLRANPDSPELLYQLGRLLYEKRQDSTRARNLWLTALRHWREVEQPKEKPNLLLASEILGGLARLETQQNHFKEAIEFLKQLKEVSPNPEAIQKQIDALQAKASGN